MVHKMSELEMDFIKALKGANIELSNDVICRIYETSINISVGQNDKNLFASDIDLYPNKKQTTYSDKGNNKISFGSSGSFDNTNIACYWRTIHAASILKNWDIVSELVNSFCSLYSEYCNEYELNNLKKNV